MSINSQLGFILHSLIVSLLGHDGVEEGGGGGWGSKLITYSLWHEEISQKLIRNLTSTGLAVVSSGVLCIVKKGGKIT